MRASEFVESYFDAWNHRDPQGIAEHMANDGIYRDIPQNIQRSPDELIVSLNDFFAHYQHRYELIGDIQKSKNAIAFQYRMCSCENNGEHEVNYRGAEFMTLHGDAAISITDYYDTPVKTLVQKYAKSGLTNTRMRMHKQRLDQIMKTRKAFLQHDLTMPALADAVGCSVNHLSQVINSGYGSSFFDYLNRYRIEHARELLSRHDNPHGAILHIAFEVGFNSNSAFYAAFKKFVGQTPAQYRRTHTQDSD